MVRGAYLFVGFFLLFFSFYFLIRIFYVRYKNSPAALAVA